MSKFFKILCITILCILLLVLSFLLFVFLKSKSWEKDFISNINSQNLVSEGLVLSDVLNEKIEKYILSEQDTNFITFNSTEVAQLIFGSISEMIGESSLSITNLYVDPALGNWLVCGRLEFKELQNIHAWVCADVSKDSMQTAQLYLKDIQVQGFSSANLYPQFLVMANKGIADALVTANENGFVGRLFENIELLEESIVVKGSLY